MRKLFRISTLALAAVACFALLTGTAFAQVTVGQLTPEANPLTECDYSAPYDEFSTSVTSGTSYVVPAPGGALTSWSTNAGAGTGQLLGLKVIRPSGSGSYTVVGVDGPRAIAPSVVNTFPVSIPVQAGDLIGLHVPSEFESSPTACWFEPSLLDRVGYREGNQPFGSTFTFEAEDTGWRMNVSASLLPPPTIAGLGTTGGSVTGGTSVVITGANFADVKGVNFGTTSATFAVNSEGQITATAPPSATIASVPVSVTTAAGSVTSASTFAYEGCVVPKLNGKKLKAAKKALGKKDCKTGKVNKRKGVTGKTGKVIKQNPKPGKVLAPGTKITIKLG